MNAYEIMNGVGMLYIAPVGTAFPLLTSTPSSPWRDLGETQDGVTVTPDQSISEVRDDQRTGPILALRDEEELIIKTNLIQHNLENLADVLGATVLDTPAGTGAIGTREISLYKGGVVAEWALLFRGKSPYGDYSAQYEVPRGFFDADTKLDFQKATNTPIPIEFHALEDLDATSEMSRFGRLIAQDAPAL